MTELITDISPDQFRDAVRLTAEIWPEEKRYTPEALADVAEGLKDNITVLAIDGNRVSGVISYSEPYERNGTREVEIDTLVTAPEARKRGIGRLLLGYVENKAVEQEVSVIALESLPDAVPFYEHLGYAYDHLGYLVKHNLASNI